MEKRQVLVISPFAPYKNVKHAGGKTHYYYLYKLGHNIVFLHDIYCRVFPKDFRTATDKYIMKRHAKCMNVSQKKPA